MTNYFDKYIIKISELLKNVDSGNLENAAKLILESKKIKKNYNCWEWRQCGNC